MTQDEARAILIHAYVSTPDMDDDLKATIASLINPPPVPKLKWWQRKRAPKR